MQGALGEPLLAGYYGLGDLVGGARPAQRAGVVDQHEPGPVHLEQGLGRAQHLLERPGQARFQAEGVQGANAAGQLGWVDRHGCRPFWVADDWRTGQQAR
jgi:hypothetical protein